jgi:prepilin-type N-terminal cleavage/methylation domain-containing protein
MTRSRPIGQGFTLVEVLIVVALLAMVLLPVMLGFSQALVTTSDSTITAAATSIARDEVEGLKTKGYASILSKARQPKDLKPGDSFFEVTVTVCERPNGAAQQGLKRAVISVYRRGGTNPVVTLTSCFAPRGV